MESEIYCYDVNDTGINIKFLTFNARKTFVFAFNANK